MRRAIILAHHDCHGIIDPHVMHALRAYRSHAERVVLVSTSARQLPAEARGLVDQFLPRDNVGYDFGSWRAGLLSLDALPTPGFTAPGFDEVLCVNDSVYGPLGEPTQALSAPRTATADLWGMVLSEQQPGNRQRLPHLQSWFFAARRALLDSAAWGRFWEDVAPQASKESIIQHHELGLSRQVTGAGFRIAALYDAREHGPPSWSEILPHLSAGEPWRSWQHLHKTRLWPHNPAEAAWHRLLAAGVPYVKVGLLRVNHYRLDPHTLWREVTAAAALAGYDPQLIEHHLARISAKAAVRGG